MQDPGKLNNMKEITNTTQMKKEVKKGNHYFLWVKKNIRILKDFTKIVSYDESGFQIKEYFISEQYALKEDQQEVSWDSISFKEWEIFLLNDDEVNEYLKIIMAKKIAKNNKQEVE